MLALYSLRMLTLCSLRMLAWLTFDSACHLALGVTLPPCFYLTPQSPAITADVSVSATLSAAVSVSATLSAAVSVRYTAGTVRHFMRHVQLSFFLFAPGAPTPLCFLLLLLMPHKRCAEGCTDRGAMQGRPRLHTHCHGVAV